MKGGFLLEQKVYSVSYDVALAKAYGIPVAVLVTNVRYFSAVNRAEGKGQYYHSMKAIGEATALSYKQVREAAKKAKEAGLIDFRFGYKPNTSEKTTYWSDETVSSEVDKRATYENDERSSSLNNIKEKNIKELDTKVSRAQQPSEYGNPDINEMFRLWQDAGLPTITSRAQASRRTIWNMLRNKAIGAERLKHGIELAGEAYGEPYAPTVLNFEDLNRKLTALEAWEQKQAVLAEQPKLQPSASNYSPAYSGEIVYERRTYDERPSILDRPIVTETFSDDFIEQCRQAVNGKKRKENRDEQR